MTAGLLMLMMTPSSLSSSSLSSSSSVPLCQFTVESFVSSLSSDESLHQQVISLLASPGLNIKAISDIRVTAPVWPDIRGGGAEPLREEHQLLLELPRPRSLRGQPQHGGRLPEDLRVRAGVTCDISHSSTCHVTCPGLMSATPVSSEWPSWPSSWRRRRWWPAWPARCRATCSVTWKAPGGTWRCVRSVNVWITMRHHL